MKTKRKWTTKDVRQYFSDYGCELLSPQYENAKKLIEYKCKCGKTNRTSFNGFLLSKHKKCHFCVGKTMQTLADIPELADQWHPTKNGNLKPEDFAAKSNKKAWWQCEKGHEWEAVICLRTRASLNRKRGNGCAKCCGRLVCLENCLATTHPDIANQWHPSKNGTLTPYDVVIGSTRLIFWLCEKGHEWKAALYSRKNGSGCPVCNESKGEKRIAEYLQSVGLPFKREAKFKKCKNKFSLPFDFIAKLPNGKGFLIEYQGAQHYKPIRRSKSWTKNKAMLALKNTQKRDGIKLEWAKKNKIPLLVIPYWEFENIPSLIEEFVAAIK